MKEKILDLMSKQTYIPSSIEQISINLNTKPSLLVDALAELVNEHIVYESKKHKFGLLKHFNMFIGVINIKDKGYGFIHSQDHLEDFYVAKKATCDAMDGDTVIFSISNTISFGKIEASVVKIVKRFLKEVIGTIVSKKGKAQFVPKENKQDIVFEVNDYGLSVIGDIVVFKTQEVISSVYVKGIIDQVIGNINDVGIEIKTLCYKYGFSKDFSSEVNDELARMLGLLSPEIKRRKLVTGNIITIDGSDAKDLDDAISIKRLANGNYLLSVYIADVSFFVRENSFLDKEAYYRGTSVYLVDRVIPMLPYKLSNDLCSLNPGEEKLVIICNIEINKNGDIENSDLLEGVIKTKYRLTYDEVNAIYNEDSRLLEKYHSINHDLLLMQELALILNKKRVKRGALDFDIPEAKIIVDQEGKPLNIVLRNRGIGEKMIEEFMLVANEVVAEAISHLELPFLYRVHDVPNFVKLQKYNNIIKSSGYNLVFKKNSISSSSLQSFLDNLQAEDKVFATLLLRTMAKAKYSAENIGHYGLASPCYTHFTAPIRRYPDLLVHRLLRLYLFKNQVDVKTQEEVLKFVIKASLQSSIKERDAIDCEYEVNDLKKAEYMLDKIGNEYDGIISSLSSFGMFIILENTIEGFVHISDLDGYFIYDEKKQILSSKNISYRVGNKLRIKVKNVRTSPPQIDFEIIRGINYGKQKSNR